MNCLACKSKNTGVTDSRCFDGRTIYRRRKCNACGARWSTEETALKESLTTCNDTIGSQRAEQIQETPRTQFAPPRPISAKIPPHPSDLSPEISISPAEQRQIRRARVDEIMAPVLARFADVEFVSSSDLRGAAIEAFELEGFAVTPDHPVELESGRRGSVDLSAEKDGLVIGVEFDNAEVRAKSMAKLQRGEFDLRVVILRTAHRGQRPRVGDLDMVVGLGGRTTREIRALNKSPEFLAWYDAYPKHVAKEDAWKAWQQTEKERPLLPEMLASLAWQSAQPDWRKDGGKFVPLPATYLRGGRWADERPKAPVNGHSPAPGAPSLCPFHRDYRTAGKPSKFPRPDCSECKHVGLLKRGHTDGAPARIGDLLGGEA